jgi:hypothetical protein
MCSYALSNKMRYSIFDTKISELCVFIDDKLSIIKKFSEPHVNTKVDTYFGKP